MNADKFEEIALHRHGDANSRRGNLLKDKAGPTIATLVNKVGRKGVLVPEREVRERRSQECSRRRSGCPAGRTPHLR